MLADIYFACNEGKISSENILKYLLTLNLFLYLLVKSSKEVRIVFISFKKSLLTASLTC